LYLKQEWLECCHGLFVENVMYLDGVLLSSFLFLQKEIYPISQNKENILKNKVLKLKQ